jgi:hypothetical protein
VLTELIPRYGLPAGYIPLKSSNNGIQIFPEHRAKPKHVWQPPNHYGEIPKCMRINRYFERATAIINGNDPPRNRRLPAATSADLEIVANPVNPLTKMPLIDPSTEIVDLILRIRPGPNLGGIARTERMA